MSAAQHVRPPLLERQISETPPRAKGPRAELRVARARSVLDGTRLSPDQVRRGLALLLAFIALRAVLTLAFDPEHIASVQDPRYLLYLGLAFLLGSVGLAYLGFTRWVKVDLLGWWIDRRHVAGDLTWGIAGAVAGAILAGALAWGTVMLGIAAAPPLQPPASPVDYAGLLFFGLAIAAFQEETLFRGFLQTAIAQRLGPLPALVLQAVAFSLAHIGYFPLDAGYLYLSAFASGLLFGWLRLARGHLVVPGLGHGLLG